MLYTTPMQRYTHLVVGGTFDHLHAGHEQLLGAAFSLSGHVLLGLTVPEMNKSKAWADAILPFEERKREIELFARKLERLSDLHIIPINDVYGSTLKDKKLEAILVTPHSLRGAQLINAGRQQRSLSKLNIEVCDLHTDQSGQTLSSSRIREGLVNRSGFVYAGLFYKTLRITEDVKEYVRQPLGESHLTFPTHWNEKRLVFVGDVVSKMAIEMNLGILSAWIDGVSQRTPYTFRISAPYTKVETQLTNDPGTINASVAAFMAEHMTTGDVIYAVQGEEDLLTLVAILLSPLGSEVIYGNPHGEKGVTVVHITEEKKEEIRSVLEHL